MFHVRHRKEGYCVAGDQAFFDEGGGFACNIDLRVCDPTADEVAVEQRQRLTI